jgi:hypothetical protein
MWRRDIPRAVLFVCLAVWASSFFLPAFDSYYWSENHHVSGFGAFGYSILMGMAGVAMLRVSSPGDVRVLTDVPPVLMIGTLWMANFLMVMAPFCLSRIERGVTKGGMFAGFLLLFSFEACALFVTGRRGDPNFSSGSYVWAASILCTSTLFLVLRLSNTAKGASPLPLRVSADK